ncbi:SGNH/GDSL hydrolase family protein [Paenibacillus albiflavus]|uniref:SGNH/GDSL hydrolase family protein n=1 Tax=Paenibacillus albiflavus TaxID=2545760 RepID=A0A4R4EDI5_9BACL|nr:SGNH/GDSL hydrolase family protein [Paenibacillus albiflavus]TCZ77789.1 SGNH/GDSL hydrolase family protein [Paenibacillus albiflavus]
MTKVLLMGDSIRLGYEPWVRECLNDVAEVVAPEENGRFAKYTLWAVNLWLKDLGTPDIVHWNNGLWDLHHEPPMVEALTSLEEYIATMERIIHELQRTGARIIFATTTPIDPAATGRNNAEIDQYNRAVIQLMQKYSIEVNDLNALVKTNMEQYICEDLYHLTDEGYKACGDQVTAHIRKYL